MTKSEIPLGSIWFWFTWKLATVLVLVVASAVVFNSPDFDGPIRFIIVGIVCALMIVSNEELVYGYASEDGIHYRRYLSERFLPWESILSIRWSASDRIKCRLKNGTLLRKNLAMQSFGGKSWAERLSEPPEVVKWLVVAKPPGADGIELDGPGL